MGMDKDEVRYQAAQAADDLVAAIREGRTGDARGLLPSIGQMLAALGGSSEMGIEDARKVLGDLARAARDEGTVTYLTSHGSPVAAIVPLGTSPAGGPR